MTDTHHGHAHHHAPMDFSRAFAIGVVLNTIFVAVEFVFGVLTDSLALVADAGHNLSDVASLLLAWGAIWLAKRPPSPRRTYGFRRVTILASFVSGIMLLMALCIILWEAVDRVRHPLRVSGTAMMMVAGVGFVVNAATAMLFMRGSHHDLNIRGAFLHMAADAAVSLGVVISGALIALTGFHLIDPVISIVIVVVILIGTWHLLRDSFALLIDSVPPHIDPQKVEDYLRGLPEVTAIHDLHIWSMSTTECVLTAHLEVCLNQIDNSLLHRIEADLMHRFGIVHITIQMERAGDIVCQQAKPDSV